MEAVTFEELQRIYEKLRFKSTTILTSRTNFFDADITERLIRNVVAIILFGDGSASRTVDIEKVEEDDTWAMIFNEVPVAPSQVQPFPPQGYNVLNPIVVLEGGTNLSGIVSAGSGLNATVIYWDNGL